TGPVTLYDTPPQRQRPVLSSDMKRSSEGDLDRPQRAGPKVAPSSIRMPAPSCRQVLTAPSEAVRQPGRQAQAPARHSSADRNAYDNDPKDPRPKSPAPRQCTP